MGRDGKPYQSAEPGTLGGHRGCRLYGRFDCRAALQALARGGYAKNRVFFRDEPAAVAAGYRPCAVCMPVEYAKWKLSMAR
ncbi:metal-binding protein [Myxococcaceae bacterium JPH2]|nr:metal-binding protein [Myxococcaceae bacterium JPH2]